MNHKEGFDREQLFFASLENMVPHDSFARIIDILVDHLPLDDLGFKHVRLNEQGNEPYHPKDLFKLMLYGQRFGIRSSVRLAKSCIINVEVMWLLSGLRPSSRTICYFRANNTRAIKNAHKYFVKQLKSWNLISGELLALDGTKIRAQNSLKNNFNQKKINRHVEYIDHKIEDYLDQLEELKNKPSKKKLKSEIQDKIENFHYRKNTYKDLEQQVKESNDGQVSTTDPDSKAVVKHRNIVEVGYNIQATVDAQNLMVVDVYAGGVNDRCELGLAAKRAQDLLGNDKIDLLADSGYYNGADIAYCERKGIRTFVPPSKKHHQKDEGFRKQDFIYNKHTDSYTCPNGQELTHELTFKRKSSNRKYRVKRYGTKMCKGCPLRSQCTTSQTGRKIERPNHEESSTRNDNRVSKYYYYYRLRQQIVEPVFGVWKRQWHFDHVLLKGKNKVEAEVTLAAITYNLVRLINIKGTKWVENALKWAVKTQLSHLKHIYASDHAKKIQKLLYCMRLQSMKITA